MVLVLLSWGWIGIASFLLGFAAMQVIGKVTGEKKFGSLELYVLVGLLCLTVYSQIFSLLAGVGRGATILLGILCLAAAAILRKKIVSYGEYLCSCIRTNRYLLLLLPVLLLVAYITAGKTWHYDTDLYHAQAIRWIEDYGVAKGLGNLHNRFAYNSAFFCLQALFSMKFIVNQSLHTVNGFVVFIMLGYAIGTLSIWKKGRLKISDCFKIGIFIYFSYLENAMQISSPGSDTLTLCMVLYISAKWAELAERKEENPAKYGVLCLLAVWTATVKLSAGVLVLLAVYPAVLFVYQKKWKQICLFVSAGLLVAAPFLIRNVIISGYLVYPYAAIDLFDVDWKMAASIAADDSREIMAWGRGMSSRPLYDAGFSVWFPQWYGKQQGMVKVLFLVNIVCMVLLMGYVIRAILKKSCINNRGGTLMLLLLVSAGQAAVWFLTAPLARYGLAYMLLLPAFFLGLACRKKDSRVLAWIICIAGICCGGYSMALVATDYTECYLKRPADYNWKEAESIMWENTEVYIPAGSDCIGYYYFPSTPNAGRLEAIEMRTGDLADGFRLKACYREKEFNSSGEAVQ